MAVPVARVRAHTRSFGVSEFNRNELVVCVHHVNEAVTVLYFTQEHVTWGTPPDGKSEWVWQYNCKEMHGDVFGIGDSTKLYHMESTYLKRWLMAKGFKGCNIDPAVRFMEGASFYSDVSNLKEYPDEED